MQITELRIRKVEDEGKLRAYVTVTFDNCFVVHNVKIIEGKSGLFIAMPSRKTANGEYKDVAHPISPEFRADLQDKILAEYEGKKVAIVSHGGSIKFFLLNWCEVNNDVKLVYHNNTVLNIKSPCLLKLTFNKQELINLQQLI
jgi:stage V sporulation protein G